MADNLMNSAHKTNEKAREGYVKTFHKDCDDIFKSKKKRGEKSKCQNPK